MTDKIKEILPKISKHPIFSAYPFQLVGGTALSYHIQHRISEDLDFCILNNLPVDAIDDFINYTAQEFGEKNISFEPASKETLRDFEIYSGDINQQFQTWKINGVKFQFFDGSGNPGIRDFFYNDISTKIDNITVASINTIFKMKSLMFYKRSKSRDLFDMLTFYSMGKDSFSPQETRKLIEHYDRLYAGECFDGLWKKSFETRPYIQEQDEGLHGLTESPKSYHEMRKELLFEFEKTKPNHNDFFKSTSQMHCTASNTRKR